MTEHSDFASELPAALCTVLARGRGRKTASRQADIEAAERTVCGAIREMAASVDFEISSRGWCYLLESSGLPKDNFDRMQSLIAGWRKRGMLPLDICVADSARVFSCVETACCQNPADELVRLEGWDRDYIATKYQPFLFWADRDVYIQLLVEKIDLVGLFLPQCQRLHIPIANARGWSDLNSRAEMMERFSRHDDGRSLVLMYCGDFDPVGMLISESLMSNMQELSEAVGWDPSGVVIDRFGLNFEFIESRGLSWIPNIKTGNADPSKCGDLADSRHRDHRKPYVQEYLANYCPDWTPETAPDGGRKCEANSLVADPDAGRQLFADAVNRWLPGAEAVIAEYEDSLEDSRRGLWSLRFGDDVGFDEAIGREP